LEGAVIRPKTAVACAALVLAASHASALEVVIQRVVAFDMRPVRFDPVEVKDLVGKKGVVARIPVSGNPYTKGIRVRVEAAGSTSAQWTLRIVSLDGETTYDEHRLVGAVDELWTGEIPSWQAIVEIVSSDPIPDPLVVWITAVSERVSFATAEGIVGRNDLEPYTIQGEPIRSWGKAVARLGIMMDGGREGVCSGFLVADDLLLTNNHCIADERQMRSVVIAFDYDSMWSKVRTHRARALLATDRALDYALLRIEGAPGLSHGKLRLRSEPPQQATQLVVVQHPEGGPKKVSRIDCTVTAGKANGLGGTETDFKHECDTQPGSSGSPIIDDRLEAVVGLHHLGCADRTCDPSKGLVNQGVLIAPIVAHLRARAPLAAAEIMSDEEPAVVAIAAHPNPESAVLTPESAVLGPEGGVREPIMAGSSGGAPRRVSAAADSPPSPSAASAEAPAAPPPSVAPARERAVGAPALAVAVAPARDPGRSLPLAAASLRPRIADEGGRVVPASAFVNDVRPEALEPVLLPGGVAQRFSIQEENDVFGLTQQSDRFYTQGLRVSTRWAPDPRRRLVERDDVEELWGFELGQNIYTPTDIKQTDLTALQHDRPYAGYLYAGLDLELRRRWSPFPDGWLVAAGPAESPATFGSGATLELRIGRTGPRALGGPIQTNFHRLLRSISGDPTPVDPAGWGTYETANVTSVDATLAVEADLVRLSTPVRALGMSGWSGSRALVRLVPRARLDVGGMIDAAGAGIELRAGLGADDVTRPRRPLLPLELYLFGRAEGRFVAYNRFIQGKLLDGLQSDVGLQRWTGELMAGATLRFLALEIVFAQVWRSNELRSVPPGSSAIHNFGVVRVSFLY
jgi:V8-like Glu-specific endopeptidase